MKNQAIDIFFVNEFRLQKLRNVIFFIHYD